MNVVDFVIVAFAIALAVIGYQRGLIASALPLIGFVGGAALGARVGQALLEGGSESEYAPLAGVLGGLVVGAFVAVALGGVGRVLRAQLHRGPGLAALDGLGGATLLATLALVVSWALGAVALNTPGPETRQVREAVQRSAILGALNDVMPPSGPLLNVLRRIDPRPELAGPDPGVGRPDRAILDDPDVARAAASTVRVLGSACGLGIAGSGWVAGPDLVVTNAHVVAGQDDTTVVDPASGSSHAAEAVHYEPRNDLAVLRVDGLGLSALGIVPRPRPGTPAATIGYPENGPLTTTPARLGVTERAVSEDSYGRGPVRRPMTSFRGRVRGGNSGGPVVDREGRVLTTVFAASRNGRPPSGLGVPNGIVGRALGGSLTPVDTGPCAA
ncbi:MAG TPA: MarP family serine protease [Solirubrobacterales bacterium]|nr:MarP family serine protease [Solirubrobacterales bacterium]